MSRACRRAALLLASTLLLGAVEARAEGGSDSARALFAAGVEAFAAEEYGAALDLFERSWEASPVTSVLYNIAMCHRALERFPESVRAFERYLEVGGPRLSEERRGEVRGLVEEMRVGLGTLRIAVEPSSALVTVGDDEVPPGSRAGHLVRAGVHEVEARAEAHEPERRAVEVRAGSSVELTLRLAPSRPGPDIDGPDDVTERDDAAAVHPHGRWWLWVAVAGAVVVGGLAVGLGVGLAADRGPGRGDWRVELP